MKKVVLSLIAVGALAFAGCSSTSPIDVFAKNLTAAQCDNQNATLSQLPLTFVTPAQAQMILAGACSALFGTSAAPATAPGNSSVFAPSAVASPAPSAAPTVAAPSANVVK